MAAQIVPNPLDRIELWAVRRQLQQRNIVWHHQSLAAVPTSTIQDHHGMGDAGDLAADLAEMMVHRQGIADWHDQRRRFALRGADRTKHIGRGKAEVLRRSKNTADYLRTKIVDINRSMGSLARTRPQGASDATAVTGDCGLCNLGPVRARSALSRVPCCMRLAGTIKPGDSRAASLIASSAQRTRLAW